MRLSSVPSVALDAPPSSTLTETPLLAGVQAMQCASGSRARLGASGGGLVAGTRAARPGSS